MTDLTTLTFDGASGDQIDVDLELEQAAAIKRGEAVAMYGGRRVRHRRLDDRRAALRARLDQTQAEQEELMREFPGVEDGEWRE